MRNYTLLHVEDGLVSLTVQQIMSRPRASFTQPSPAISANQMAYRMSAVGVNNGHVAYVFEFREGQSLNFAHEQLSI